MSQADTEYIKAQNKALGNMLAYVHAQLKSIAYNIYGHDAIKKQTARTANMVGSIVAAQTVGLSAVILQASKDGGISEKVLAEIQERARAGTQQAIDEAESDAQAAAAEAMADLDDLEVMDDDTTRALEGDA